MEFSSKQCHYLSRLLYFIIKDEGLECVPSRLLSIVFAAGGAICYHNQKEGCCSVRAEVE